MVHLRLNESEPNPNPHINFIRALPRQVPQDQEEARQLLRALAAQVRPVMKAHGFVVNSFEEYEHNAVFAGRNWGNGETVELVLRRADGSYCLTSWLLGTLCHELAHIEHSNHGPAFQALCARLQTEVRQLQDKGYYGDGYWSSGARLADSVRISGDGIERGDVPEYMCGGAQTGARPRSLRRQRQTMPSLHTGRQTAKRRKAGRRVTSKFAFVGDGRSLADDSTQSSKGKRAASNRAREERALAAEKRLIAFSGNREPTSSHHNQAPDENSESESEIEFVQETDAERRQALLDSELNHGEDDRALGKGLLWKEFEKEFNLNLPQQGSGPKARLHHPDVIELTDEDSEVDGGHCEKPTPFDSALTSSQRRTSKGKQKEGPHSLTQIPSTSGLQNQPEKLSFGNIVKDEIEHRKKEALGLAPLKGADRTLGTAPEVNKARGRDLTSTMLGSNVPEEPTTADPSFTQMWGCLICTLINKPEHLACMACATPRGEDTYHIR